MKELKKIRKRERERENGKDNLDLLSHSEVVRINRIFYRDYDVSYVGQTKIEHHNRKTKSNINKKIILHPSYLTTDYKPYMNLIRNILKF